MNEQQHSPLASRLSDWTCGSRYSELRLDRYTQQHEAPQNVYQGPPVSCGDPPRRYEGAHGDHVRSKSLHGHGEPIPGTPLLVRVPIPNVALEFTRFTHLFTFRKSITTLPANQPNSYAPGTRPQSHSPLSFLPKKIRHMARLQYISSLPKAAKDRSTLHSPLQSLIILRTSSLSRGMTWLRNHLTIRRYPTQSLGMRTAMTMEPLQ